MPVNWERRHEAFKAIHDAIRSGIAQAPEGKIITKVEVGEDANGKVKQMKFYENTELLFTLTWSDAGAVETSYTITRT